MRLTKGTVEYYHHHSVIGVVMTLTVINYLNRRSNSGMIETIENE